MSKKLLSDLDNNTGDYGYRSESRIKPKNKKGSKGSSAGRVFGIILALIQLAASVYFIYKIYAHIPTTYLAVLIVILLALFAVSLFTQKGKPGVRTFGKIFSVIMTIIMILLTIFSDKVIEDLMRLSGNKTVDVDTPFVVFVSAADDFGENATTVIKKKRNEIKDAKKQLKEGVGSNKKAELKQLIAKRESEISILQKQENTKSDTNILAIVNPKTYTVLLVSTPRDYYVKVRAKSVDPNSPTSYDKLTHVGMYGSGIGYKSDGEEYDASEWSWAGEVYSNGMWGTTSMYDEKSGYNSFTALMNTLKDLYSIDIDDKNYSYVRLNFTGFGRLIDAMDGIDVKVKESFMTRTYANYENDEGRADYTFNKGKQHMNGIEALTFARERKKVSGGDMGRNKNQVKVIKAMANKALSAKTYLSNNYNSIISAVGDAFTTDMDIVSLVDFQSAIMSQRDYDGWNILSYSVIGTSSSNQLLWNGIYKSTVLPDEESVSNAKTLIQMTLNGDSSAAIEKKIKAYSK